MGRPGCGCCSECASLFKIDKSNGQIIWSKNLAFNTTAVYIYDNKIYASTYCYNQSGGYDYTSIYDIIVLDLNGNILEDECLTFFPKPRLSDFDSSGNENTKNDDDYRGIDIRGPQTISELFVFKHEDSLYINAVIENHIVQIVDGEIKLIQEIHSYDKSLFNDTYLDFSSGEHSPLWTYNKGCFIEFGYDYITFKKYDLKGRDSTYINQDINLIGLKERDSQNHNDSYVDINQLYEYETITDDLTFITYQFQFPIAGIVFPYIQPKSNNGEENTINITKKFGNQICESSNGYYNVSALTEDPETFSSANLEAHAKVIFGSDKPELPPLYISRLNLLTYTYEYISFSCLQEFDSVRDIIDKNEIENREISLQIQSYMNQEAKTFYRTGKIDVNKYTCSGDLAITLSYNYDTYDDSLANLQIYYNTLYHHDIYTLINIVPPVNNGIQTLSPNIRCNGSTGSKIDLYKVKINDDLNCGYIEKPNSVIQTSIINGSGNYTHSNRLNSNISIYGDITGEGSINFSANGYYRTIGNMNDTLYYTAGRYVSYIDEVGYLDVKSGDGLGIVGNLPSPFISDSYAVGDNGHPNYNDISLNIRSSKATDSGGYFWGPDASLSFYFGNFFKKYIETTDKIAEAKLTSLAFSQVSKSYNRKDSNEIVFNAIMVGNWTVYQNIYAIDYNITEGNSISYDDYGSIFYFDPYETVTIPVVGSNPPVTIDVIRPYTSYEGVIKPCDYYYPSGFFYIEPITGRAIPASNDFHPYKEDITPIAHFECDAEAKIYKGKLTPYATVYSNTKVLIRLNKETNNYNIELDNSSNIDYSDYNLFLSEFDNRANNIKDGAIYNGINTLRNDSGPWFREANANDYLDNESPYLSTDILGGHSINLEYRGNSFTVGENNTFTGDNYPHIVDNSLKDKLKYRDYEYCTINSVYIPDNLSNYSGIPKVINDNGVKYIQSNFANNKINDTYSIIDSTNSDKNGYRLLISDNDSEYIYVDSKDGKELVYFNTVFPYTQYYSDILDDYKLYSITYNYNFNTIEKYIISVKNKYDDNFTDFEFDLDETTCQDLVDFFNSLGYATEVFADGTIRDGQIIVKSSDDILGYYTTGHNLKIIKVPYEKDKYNIFKFKDGKLIWKNNFLMPCRQYNQFVEENREYNSYQDDDKFAMDIHQDDDYIYLATFKRKKIPDSQVNSSREVLISESKISAGNCGEKSDPKLKNIIDYPDKKMK